MTTRSEIESRLADFAATQKLPVAYENISFTKPTKGSYLAIHFTETASYNRNLAADGVRTTGMFQVSCYAPLGTGMAAVEALVNGVIATFPVLPKTGTVSIESPLNASSAIVLDDFICVPVTGRYRVET